MRNLFFTVLAFVLLTSCNHKHKSVPDCKNSVYYWRTVYQLDSVERQFLKQNHVGKIYMRYFDVVVKGEGELMPNATIKFAEAMPQGVEIVPTIFIVENALKHDVKGLAGKIVKRVLQMNETNGIAGVKELQIDCDWTINSQRTYFAFLETARSLLKGHGLRLSATIRLHQLNMTPPPVDYGVLMVYNTGDASDYTCHNPILDYKDVKPYFKYVASYDLPLCAAYPNFGWNLLFTGKEYKTLLYEANLNDTLVFKQVAPKKYVAISSRTLPSYLTDDNTRVNMGDSIFVKDVPAALLHKVHDELSAMRPEINRQVIIYDLESKNIKYYHPQDYEKIFLP